MNRLTADCATGNFETMMNYVFGRDGWAHIISDGEHDNVPLTAWAKEQCIKRGCDEFPGETPEEIDETLCDCLADGDGCPVALAYCFGCQACHLRDRLKQYEDTGLMPEEGQAVAEMFSGEPYIPILQVSNLVKAYREGRVEILPPNDPLTLDELREMDGEPVWEEWAGHSQEGWALVRVWSKNSSVILLTYNNGVTDMARFVLDNGGKIYRRKPEAGEPPC